MDAQHSLRDTSRKSRRMVSSETPIDWLTFLCDHLPVALEKRKNLPLHVCCTNLYPIPWTVLKWTGFAGSVSSFCRSLRI